MRVGTQNAVAVGCGNLVQQTGSCSARRQAALARVLVPFRVRSSLALGEAFPELRQLGAEAAVEDEVADLGHDAAEEAVVDLDGQLDLATRVGGEAETTRARAMPAALSARRSNSSRIAARSTRRRWSIR